MSGQTAFENYYAARGYKTKEPDYFYDRSPREIYTVIWGELSMTIEKIPITREEIAALRMKSR